MTGQTLLEKLWASHEILSKNGASLLWADRHLVHKGSHHAFAKLVEHGLKVTEPSLTTGVVDHYAPTRGPTKDPAIADMIARLVANTGQGIVHAIGPEQGLTQPGLLVTCGDSHTSTHDALGALAFGIGASQVAHVLATQTVWQKNPNPYGSRSPAGSVQVSAPKTSRSPGSPGSAPAVAPSNTRAPQCGPSRWKLARPFATSPSKEAPALA